MKLELLAHGWVNFAGSPRRVVHQKKGFFLARPFLGVLTFCWLESSHFSNRIILEVSRRGGTI